MRTIVLASQSPRRRELLQAAGFEFTIASVEISEIPSENLNLQDQIMDLARRKAEALVMSGKLSKGQRVLVLAADTLVVLGQLVLGKPKSRAEAAEYLRRLSGKLHSVITGICLWDLDSGRVVTDFEKSDVMFRDLSPEQIERYAASGEGLDKAGGYGIQGAAGKFVKELRGPLDNVVGLPVDLLNKLLLENGWDVRRGTSSAT